VHVSPPRWGITVISEIHVPRMRRQEISQEINFIPVSRLKVAVHCTEFRATGVFKVANYIEFHVSLSNHYCKNMYSGIGSGIPLCLGLFEAGLSDKAVETVSDLSLFADLPSLPLINHYRGRDFPPFTNDVIFSNTKSLFYFFWWIKFFTSTSPGISGSIPPLKCSVIKCALHLSQ
jgi:hypothetical protein